MEQKRLRAGDRNFARRNVGFSTMSRSIGRCSKMPESKKERPKEAMQMNCECGTECELSDLVGADG